MSERALFRTMNRAQREQYAGAPKSHEGESLPGPCPTCGKARYYSGTDTLWTCGHGSGGLRDPAP